MVSMTDTGFASIAIHDDEGREVPSGTIGKIYVRSAMMPDFTYINRHGDREGIENKGYVTLGDLGYVDQDGYLFIADRRTDLVISGGVNIYPAEIEHVLIEMPGVSDCAVFGIPDPEFGQSLVAANGSPMAHSLTTVPRVMADENIAAIAC